MTGAETRDSNYFDHRSSGALGNQQRIVMDSLREFGSATRSELAVRTGLRLSSVCARTNELIAAGLLSEYPTCKCACTGRTVTPVGLPVPIQASLDLSAPSVSSNAYSH